MIEDIVNFIIDTYELSEKARRWVVPKTIEMAKAYRLSSFDEIYSLVGHMVDSLRVPYNERGWLRLDQQLSMETEDTMHPIISSDDLANRPEIPPAYKSTLVEALNLIETEIGSELMPFLSNLAATVTSRSHYIGLSSKQIYNRIQEVIRRTRVVMSEFSEGEFKIAPRPIKEISFDPFLITYGNRRYGGRPIDFYLEHEDVYRGKSRFQLSKFDSGLYFSLVNTGQISLAIPEVLTPNTLTSEQITRILESHTQFKGIASKAARKLEHKATTVTKYWREYGLDTTFRLLSETEKSRIRGLYDVTSGNARQTARKTGVHPSTVRYHWGKGGLVAKGRSELSNEDVSHIESLYARFEGNAQKAADYSGHFATTVKKYWKKAGFQISKGGRTLPPSKQTEIINAYETYDGNATLAEKKIGVSKQTILKYWKDKDFKIRDGSNLPESDVEKIVNAYETFKGNASKAAKSLGHAVTSVLRCWDGSGLRSRYKRLSEAERTGLITAYEKYCGNASEAARNLPYSITTIIRNWRNQGLKVKQKHLSNDQILEVLGAHETYGANAARAARHLPYSRQTFLDHWKANELITVGKGKHKRAK